MLRTRLTDHFNIDYPIMSAPMAMHTSGSIAAAVSNAGAIGMFGGISPTGPDWLRTEIRKARELTDRQFGVGFITHLLPIFPALIDVAIEQRVPIFAFSFADPARFTSRAKESGATVICQVQSMVHAREAVAAGADILVAQGNEAGGHTGRMNLLPLLVNLVDEYPEIPVLAAGGITSGRALATALAAGADGAWLGTAILATEECQDVSDAYKRAIVESDGEDTVYTSVLDKIQTKVMDIPPWPDGIAERVKREPLVEKWEGRAVELESSLDEAVQEYQERRSSGETSILMGQGAGAIDSVQPVADVISSICIEAERILREGPAAIRD